MRQDLRCNVAAADTGYVPYSMWFSFWNLLLYCVGVVSGVGVTGGSLATIVS